MTALLLVPAVLWLLPLVADMIAIGLRASRPTSPPAAPPPRARLLFLVPAHEEADRIAGTVASILAQDRTNNECMAWVVADNCRDATAARARDAGAQVLERHDADQPGKPAAIAWALPQLPLGEADAVVIIDADSGVAPDFAARLAARGPLGERVLQGWLGIANPRGSWLTRLASLFGEARYAGQYRLKDEAGLSVPLTGNGMCLGTGILARHGWRETSITEDAELYARYTAAGIRIGLAADAIVYAHEAASVREGAVQRRRWQAGRVQVLFRHGGALLRSRRISAAQKLDALADLSYPGPVVHTSVGGLAGLACLTSGDSLVRVAGALFLAGSLHAVGWTCWALLRRPDRGRLLLDLARLPAYALWRLGVAARALVSMRGARWERSPRD